MSNTVSDIERLIRLGDVAKIVMGQAPSSDQVKSSGAGIPFLQGNGEFGKKHPSAKMVCDKPSRTCRAGDILISVRAPVGDINIADREYAIGRGLAAIQFFGIDKRFGFHSLKYSSRRLHQVAQGSTFDAISKSDLANLRIFAPASIIEQQRIADILDSIDSQIYITEQIASKYKITAQAAASALIPCSPDPRQVADNWETPLLSEVVPSADYGISSPLTTDFNGTPTLRMGNLANGRINLTELKSTTEPLPEHLLLRDGDVLFNRTNSIEHVGRTSMWRSELPRATFASYLVRLNVDAARLEAGYLVRWLNQPAIQQRIRRLATPGVHQVNINPTSLRSIHIELPKEISEQQRIIAILDDFDSVINKQKAELGQLKLVKRGLMHDLLGGKAQVP